MQASKHQKYMSDCFSSNICSSSSSSWCWYVRRSMFPLRRAPGSSGLLIRAAAIIENPFQHPTNTNQWFLTTEMQSCENTFWTAGFLMPECSWKGVKNAMLCQIHFSVIRHPIMGYNQWYGTKEITMIIDPFVVGCFEIIFGFRDHSPIHVKIACSQWF